MHALHIEVYWLCLLLRHRSYLNAMGAASFYKLVTILLIPLSLFAIFTDVFTDAFPLESAYVLSALFVILSLSWYLLHGERLRRKATDLYIKVADELGRCAEFTQFGLFLTSCTVSEFNSMGKSQYKSYGGEWTQAQNHALSYQGLIAEYTAENRLPLLDGENIQFQRVEFIRTIEDYIKWIERAENEFSNLKLLTAEFDPDDPGQLEVAVYHVKNKEFYWLKTVVKPDRPSAENAEWQQLSKRSHNNFGLKNGELPELTLSDVILIGKHLGYEGANTQLLERNNAQKVQTNTPEF